MTAVMLAAYPDVFSAGAVVAGLPYDCTRDSSPYTCMNPGVDRSPADWAQRVRDAHPSYTGPWPRTAIWYGDQDTTVVPRNATELRDQWTAVHGLPQTPTRTTTIGPNGTRQEQYLATDGTVAVEVDRVPGIGHGTRVDPGTGAEQCGSTGAPLPRLHLLQPLDRPVSSVWTPPAPVIPARATRTRAAAVPPAGRRATTPMYRRAGPPPAAATPTPWDPARTWVCTTRSSPTP